MSEIQVQSSSSEMPTNAEAIASTSPDAAQGPPSSASDPSGAVDWSKPRVAAILRAAVRCFARSGFDTTTAEIAAEIGIPKSVIYHYFDDKTTLVREAQRFAYAEHLQKMRAAVAGIHGETGKAVVDVLRAVWALPQSRGIGFQLGIWSELRNDAKVREQAVALRQEHHGMIAQGVARALGVEDPARTEPLSTLIVAALTGLSLNSYLEGDSTKADAAHEVLLKILETGIERFAKRPDSELPPPSVSSELESVFPSAYESVPDGVVRN